MKLVIFILVALVALPACNNPGDLPLPESGRRDYSWQIDTIAPPNAWTTLYDIWGSAPNDVWAVGYAVPSKYSVWHFDGERWSPDSSVTISFATGIYGFSPLDVWIIDLDGGIWHFNESGWGRVTQIHIENFDFTNLNSIWGTSSWNLYVTGMARSATTRETKPILAHFDGSNWTNITGFPTSMGLTRVLGIEAQPGIVFLSGSSFAAEIDSGFVYRYDGLHVQKLAAFPYEATPFDLVGSEVMFVNEGKLLHYRNRSLVLWRDFSAVTPRVQYAVGRSEADIFFTSTVGYATNLLHFNGTDVQPLLTVDGYIWERLLFEKDVFFLNHTETNLIVHGTLRDEFVSR